MAKSKNAECDMDDYGSDKLSFSPHTVTGQPTRSLQEMAAALLQSNEEVRVLKDERRALTEELQSRVTEQETVLRILVRIQGMFSQFSRPEIRSRFLSGDFIKFTDYGNFLSCIDVFKNILLPVPGGKSTGASYRMSFLGKLLSKSTSEPLDANGCHLPVRKQFSWWRDMFELMMNSEGWTSTVSGGFQDGCNGRAYEQFSAPPLSPIRKPLLVEPPEQKFDTGFSGAKRTSRNIFQMRDDTSSSSDDSAIKERFTNHGRNSGRHSVTEETLLLRALRELVRKKEVLAPIPFSSSSSTSFHKFLRSYERYFDAKYDGTDEEKAAHLEGFLEGSAKAAYRALNGSTIKFSILKSKLVSWYDSQLSDLRETHQRKFYDAVMGAEDTCGIYCLHLEQLATKAFKDSPAELEHQLKKKFKETAPRALILQIDNADTIFSITSETNLSWKQWKRLVEQFDRKKSTAKEAVKKEETLPLFMSLDHQSVLPSQNLVEHRRFRSQTFKRKDDRPKSKNVTWKKDEENKSPQARFSQFQGARNSPGVARHRRTNLICEWCDKTGHSEDRCWAKQKRCLSCGSDEHWMSRCPKVCSRVEDDDIISRRRSDYSEFPSLN